ncbi:fibrinogen C domain-containing protein 1-B-like [Homarus americanus]|uniref:fibrinogen C domain-containing protein 1-B-like n=1 Tax=Homarus americanus TaxID=6706 RepID=UPI001C46CB2F|nr:fibrinogen C domain-containing protein 1-B-like [Homarus americanus]
MICQVIMEKSVWVMMVVGICSASVMVVADNSTAGATLLHRNYKEAQNPTDDTDHAKMMFSRLGIKNNNCLEWRKLGFKTSGVYDIYPYYLCPTFLVQVYCDMTTDGGGWTVIQRREDLVPREDFYRTWMEYLLGFGHLSGEFWAGLDLIHFLTYQKFNQIRFDLTDFNNNTRWAQYQFFYVHDKRSSYKVEVNGYTGDAGDGFSDTNGNMFTTKDYDVDIDDNRNCAVSFKGAWWYKSCHHSNLNGQYHRGNHTSFADGVNWEPFRGYHYSLKTTEMKIRPAY